MFHTLLAYIGLIAVAGVCGFAMIAGSSRERLAGLACVCTYAVQYLAVHYVPLPDALRYLGPDLVCLGVFFALCWKAPYPWPLWITGFQLVSVMIEVTSLTHHLQVELRTFLTLEIVSGYAVLLTLLAGTVNAIRMRRARKSV